MKGIILAGGLGTRLYPITSVVSKQLLPIYDKPMIYYPLSTLMVAGIREILIITTPRDEPLFRSLLGDGEQLGISLAYKTQAHPEGLAQAFIIGKNFIGNSSVSLILGDNLFYGESFSEVLRSASNLQHGGIIFGYWVNEPERYGILMFDEHKKVIDIVEKPNSPPSNYAVTGLYFYDNQVVDIASELQPSSRNELEITDVNKYYLRSNQLNVETLSRGVAWLDTGTYESFLQASLFVQTIEKRQGLKIACIEEIAYQMGYITSDQVVNLALNMKNNSYANYLRKVIEF